MTEKKVLSEDIKKVEEYLKGYSLNRKLVELEKYEKEYFGGDEAEWEARELPADLPLARVRMFEIRHFVMALPNCEEKLLLYYRYIKGESIENCAELLGVSRSTAYRIKDKALALAARSRDAGGCVRELS